MSRVAESDPGILEGSGYGFLKSSDPDQVCIGWIRTQFFFKMGHSGSGVTSPGSGGSLSGSTTPGVCHEARRKVSLNYFNFMLHALYMANSYLSLSLFLPSQKISGIILCVLCAYILRH